MNEHFLILAGWLIDGTGGPIRKGVTLEIADGLILSSRPSGPYDSAQPDFVNLSHCTLIPGLVDCHVHLFMSSTDDPDIRRHQLNAPFQAMKNIIARHLVQHLAHGVVAVRDGGDYAAHTLRYKKECLPHDQIPLLVRSAGKAWHAPGRYGELIGRPPLKGRTLAQSILKGQKGVDHVKIVNSGLNSLYEFGTETAPQFDLDPLKEAVNAGRSLGLKTMVHANGKLAVGLAIEAGCHSIEHGFFMGKENLFKMAEKGITWVPTAFTMEAYSRALSPGRLESEIAKGNLDHQLDQIRMACDYGVPIAVGTDSGSLGVHHGQSISEEMRLLLSAGLSLEKVIQSATSNGSRLLDMEKEVGRITPGGPATFLVIRGDPGRLLEHLCSPVKIYIKGRILGTASHSLATRRNPIKNSL
ncbi:MAG: amidohydrolase family protein [Pseudomonadota bacterium]